MTDPMDDLRQSSAEVSGVEVLSPAALSVWDAFCNIVENHGPPRLGIAAALRAAADQVVPVTSARTAAAAGKRRARADLLAIAAELEGHHG